MTRTITRRRATPSTFDSYLHEINSTPLLSAEEERELTWRVAEEGDAEARDHLMRANLRLVVNVARQYANKGLPMEDLIAEGNMGLIRSVEGFDPSVGVRFSTYACYWIKQSIKRAVINTAKTVRVPAYAAQLMVEWRRASAGLQDELGRAPADEEVVDRLGLSAKRLKIVKKALRIQAVAAPREEGCEDLLPSLPCGNDAPDALVGGEEEVRQVLRLLDQLEKREAAVLRLRFGLGGEEPRTLKVVGERLGLTRERVRQIERDALRNVRVLLEDA